MRIALLNLPVDSNYGGNLQRYALMSVLKKNGHHVTHLNLHFNPHIAFSEKIFWFLKQVIKKFIRPSYHVSLSWKRNIELDDKKRCEMASPFYEKYIEHTSPIRKKNDLVNYTDFDVFIVGSDQVWRPCMTKSYGLGTYFFDYLPKESTAKLVAYAVSIGVSFSELSAEQIRQFNTYYKRFDLVSVRELSSLELFSSFGWTTPKAELSLDPTLLLDKSEYVKIIAENDTCPSNGDMFCYILDTNDEKIAIINDIAKNKDLKPFYQLGCENANAMSIPQWLRSFHDAKFVVTDSYHGMVFSIIFNKPFKVLMNEGRGVARFESLTKLLHIDLNDAVFNWNGINSRKRELVNSSLEFIKRI